ncbi:MAG: hypothetical protein ACJA01_000618 [Saprospiraceae bacterium]|jgi:hypothetical protein
MMRDYDLIICLVMTAILGILPREVVSQKTLYNIFKTIAYDGKRMDYREAGGVFMKVPQSLSLYERSLQQSKSDKTTGKITAGFGIGGLLLIVIDNDIGLYNESVFPLSPGDRIGALMILLGMSIRVVTSLINQGKAKRSRLRAIEVFHENQPIGYHDAPSVELSIAGTSNGIGLVLNF